MCGICGKLRLDSEADVQPQLVKAMADTIAHRGPDDEGYYFSGRIGLGFRRLSIIDLSGGHQPLSNEDSNVWIVFNGEIYNYQELRAFLLRKGHVFRTNSDTEVIVHLYEEFGEACVEKLRGMFSFAIWDDRQKTLLLARDRIGIKPLYYYLSNKSLIFASEIKAILADSEVEREVEPAMVDRLLTFNFLPGDDTLLRNVHKLAPGSYMIVRHNKPEIRQYWDLSFSGSNLSLQEAEQHLLALLDETTRLHMISDVPVGFLLSGGIDSTALLSIATGMTSSPINSFTVGFSDHNIPDERPYARLAANKYGTVHHEITITSKDFEQFLPKYVWFMEEPICEPPAIALYFVSKLARESVKVLISGEGGDEAFGGYPIYRNLLWLERIKRALGPLNGGISTCLLALNQLLHSSKIEKYAPLMSLPLSSYYYSGISNPFRYFNRHADEIYTKDFLRHVNKESSIRAVTKYFDNGVGSDLVNKLLYVDTKTWLAHDLLLKADKMTMANSIELRVPFLDHKVLEFAASLPGDFKVHGLTTKYIAKRAFANTVPREILMRKKAGFPVPYDSWLRSNMRDWLREVLLDRTSIARGYFQKGGLENLISEDLQRGGYSKELFTLASLELWHRAFLKN